MMRLYEIALIAALLLIVVLAMAARHRYERRCPRCGEREGQLLLSQREISTRRIWFRIPWFARSRWHRQPFAAKQRFFEGTKKCSACGHTYEHRWFEQLEMF